MTIDHTQIQDDDENRKSQNLSKQRIRPPSEIPGYETQRFLGAGAYGEVWVALDRNTGRQVAIKYYTHRGGLDWSLLSREVEKLVFLSADRYVVQLLDVGWDAEPPYYVMEYVEQGSLDDFITEQGPLSVNRAVALFREVAIGLVHAHDRGVLHCDLKPANILLDRDLRPRLADFGQSRLSHEQDPALGTLFYMAPEQADLKAVPDARWDVYALGSLLYCMLTGSPPHRSEQAIAEMESARDLEDRLARYRKCIEQAPPPASQRKIPGLDRNLAEILDRCLSARPQYRYPNAQAVVDALDERDARQKRRPLVVLGAVLPFLLMLVMFFAAVNGLNTAVKESDKALTARALASNQFAAGAQAESVASEVERRFRAVERLAEDVTFQGQVAVLLANEELKAMAAKLNDPKTDAATITKLRKQYIEHPARQALQERFDALLLDPSQPEVASWFINGPEGLQLANAPYPDTIAKNYAWRTYFHGEPQDRPKDWRATGGEHVRQTHLSAVFLSQASGRWKAGISTPVYEDPLKEKLLGVLALTVEVGHFVKLQGGEDQLAVLVDWRDGPNKGLILQHPLFDKLLKEEGRLPDRFKDLRIGLDRLPVGGDAEKSDYRDPMGEDQSGAAYRGRWLADVAPVKLHGEPSNLLVIVQETHQHAIGQTLEQLRHSLFSIGVIAAVGIMAVTVLLWGFVLRVLGGTVSTTTAPSEGTSSSQNNAAETMSTIPDRRKR